MSSSPGPPVPSSDAQAAPSPPEGCLWRFIIPPFSVILMGLFLYLGLSRINTGQAESPALSQSDTDNLQGGIAFFFTPEVQAWENEIQEWGENHHLDPNLVATVMQIESCGFIKARSGVGAMGLFQVMPYHFQDGEDPYDPRTNAKRGLNYLRMALESGNGSSRLALAGYNGGIAGAQRPRDQWNNEMLRYEYWGYQIYQDAKAGLETSPRLGEWLNSGGDYLCQQARENN